MPAPRRSLTVLTPTELAEMLRMKADTVRRKLAEAGVEPRVQDGRVRRFDSLEALSALLASDKLDLSAERARLAKQQADAQALKNAQQRGELVPAADQDSALIGLSTVVSSRLQGMGTALAPKLAAEPKPARCQRLVDDAIEAALSDLAREGERAAQRAREGARPAVH